MLISDHSTHLLKISLFMILLMVTVSQSVSTLIYLEPIFESIIQSRLGFKKIEKKSPLYASLSCKMIFLHFRKNAGLKIRN